MSARNITVEPANRICAGEKRQLLPFILHGKCPSCGHEWDEDLSRHHLSYPKWGYPQEHVSICSECEHEWSFDLIVHVSLEVL